MTTLARRERTALCDLALALGPDAPTLCEGWDVADLATHLLVRERRPVGALGIMVPALSSFTDQAMADYRRRDFGQLVERLRSPGLSPYALPPLEKTLNTLEYAVHHEDVRRAQPGWEPRALPADDLDLLWSLVARSGALLGRGLPAPTVFRRSDTGASATLRKGSGPVTVTGDVVELLLFLFGRSATRDLRFQGPPDRVEAVRGADLGV